MVTLVLVRHAVTATTGKRLYGQQPGHPLDASGRRQAAAVAARLATADVEAVYASPLDRAQQTAAPVARAHRLRVRTRAGLSEPDVGDWTGKALGNLRRRREWAGLQRHPSRFRFPGGESYRQVQQRACDVVEAIVTSHSRTVVVVSHADTIKVVLAHYLGLHLDQFQRLVVAPASLSVITAAPDQSPVLLSLNDTAHLGSPMAPP